MGGELYRNKNRKHSMWPKFECMQKIRDTKIEISLFRGQIRSRTSEEGDLKVQYYGSQFQNEAVCSHEIKNSLQKRLRRLDS